MGLIVNPIIPIYRDRELAFILADANTNLIFIPTMFRDFDYTQMLQRLRGDLPELRHIVTVRDCDQTSASATLEYAALVQRGCTLPLTPAVVDPNSVKIILYTSGTTGRAKAVQHSHNTLTRALDNSIEAWQVGADDVMLMPSPVTHITGFVNGIELPFFSDARSALMERWNVQLAIDYIQRVQATLCVSATPFLQELAQTAEQQKIALPSLRMFACGGAAVAPDLINHVHRVLPNCRASRVYGSTEVPLVTVGFQQLEQAQLGAETDGRIHNYSVRVVDDDNCELPLGRDGELLVRGAAMMLGYGDAEQTREALSADGFFYTGDIGHITADGAIVITDRKKDIIIRGGENLSAKEIEDVLHGHASIHEVAVVSMPHLRLGEGVCAFAILREGCTELTLAELQPFLQQAGLARQKWPERIEVCAELPRTASGKIRKDQLRAQLRG